jgi:transposase
VDAIRPRERARRAAVPKTQTDDRQLREALQSRFKVEHHGIMVAQLLAHIDTLDGAIENLSERIEFVLTRHASIIELLCTIPGGQLHAAQGLIAECGLDMTLLFDARGLGR